MEGESTLKSRLAPEGPFYVVSCYRALRSVFCFLVETKGEAKEQKRADSKRFRYVRFLCTTAKASKSEREEGHGVSSYVGPNGMRPVGTYVPVLLGRGLTKKLHREHVRMRHVLLQVSVFIPTGPHSFRFNSNAHY